MCSLFLGQKIDSLEDFFKGGEKFDWEDIKKVIQLSLSQKLEEWDSMHHRRATRFLWCIFSFTESFRSVTPIDLDFPKETEEGKSPLILENLLEI